MLTNELNLTFDEMFATKTCVLGWLPLFVFPRDGGTSQGTYPQPPPLWVFFLRRDSVKAQPRLVSSSICAANCTTTIGILAKDKPVKPSKWAFPQGRDVTWKLCIELQSNGRMSCSACSWYYDRDSNSQPKDHLYKALSHWATYKPEPGHSHGQNFYW